MYLVYFVASIGGGSDAASNSKGTTAYHFGSSNYSANAFSDLPVICLLARERQVLRTRRMD